MSTPAGPHVDTGDIVTPGFVQSLDVWGRYVRAGGGPLRGARTAAWWLFDQYGTDPPTRPPTVAEQDAFDVVLNLPARSRSVSPAQTSALSTVSRYLESACPQLDPAAPRPQGSPFTLQEAADDLVGRSTTGDLPMFPADPLTSQAAKSWDDYTVMPDGPLSDDYWDAAPGGTDTRTVDMERSGIVGE